MQLFALPMQVLKAMADLALKPIPGEMAMWEMKAQAEYKTGGF